MGNEDLKTKTSKRLRQILAPANSSGNLSEDRGGGEIEKSTGVEGSKYGDGGKKVKRRRNEKRRREGEEKRRGGGKEGEWRRVGKGCREEGSREGKR